MCRLTRCLLLSFVAKEENAWSVWRLLGDTGRVKQKSMLRGWIRGQTQTHRIASTMEFGPLTQVLPSIGKVSL